MPEVLKNPNAKPFRPRKTEADDCVACRPHQPVDGQVASFRVRNPEELSIALNYMIESQRKILEVLVEIKGKLA